MQRYVFFGKKTFGDKKRAETNKGKKRAQKLGFIKFLLPLQRQTKFLFVAQLVEQLTLNQRVTGSSPVEETKENQPLTTF
jgi:hypothetical protein